jgi:serine/threonine protein kinase
MLDPQASRFWKGALQSELIDAEGLNACFEAIPPEKRVAEHIDRRMARQAVTRGLITLWQAQQLIAGRVTGFKVNRYVLLDLIGQGGMGRVYLAKDSRLNRRVAVKILSPERVNNARAIARFQREARVGAQLQHENLVRIYDEGEANGKCYIVMEYIEGKNIGAMIAEGGPLPSHVASRLARQVALGLAHAHQKGLIHRDVNPYNILVTLDGTAKLADLGLAIDLADQAPVTREGATVGTFDYVSPEQARHSHAVDTRSDIYSLGCTLYHMIAGRVPYPSPSLPEKLFGHQALEPEPLTALAPDVPEGLAAVVKRMMRKSPDERFATPLEVAQALEPFTNEDSTQTSWDVTPPILPQPRDFEALAGQGGGYQSGLEPNPPPIDANQPSSWMFPSALKSPRIEPIDLGISLDGGSTGSSVDRDSAASSAPASTPAPPPIPRNLQDIPAPAKPTRVAKPDLPPEAVVPGKVGKGADREGLDLGIDLDAANRPAPPARERPARAPAVERATPAPKAEQPPPAAPAPPKTRPRPEEALPFEISVGPSETGAAGDTIDLGLSLNPAPEPPPRAEPPARKPQARQPEPPPPKPTPRNVEPAPELPADFAASLGSARPAEGPFSLGLDLGPAPPLSTPKATTRAVPTAADGQNATTNPPRASARKRGPALDARTMIGAGAVVVILIVAAIAISLRGSHPASTTDRTARKKSEQVKDEATRPDANQEEPQARSVVDREPKPKPKPSRDAKADVKEAAPKSEFDEPARGSGYLVRLGNAQRVYEPDLQGAMQVAINSHGRVVLNNSEPIQLKESDAAIRVAGGRLIVAAEPGTAPVLEVEVKGKPFLAPRLDTPVQLIGITIRARFTGADAETPPLISAGHEIVLENCILKADGPARGKRAVVCEGGNVRAVGCWFDGFDHAFDVAVFGGKTLRFQDCIFSHGDSNAGWPTRLRNFSGRSTSDARQLAFEQCTVRAAGLFDLEGFSDKAVLSVTLKDSVIQANTLLAWSPAGGGPLPSAALRWSGSSNLYDVHGKAWIVAKAGETAAAANSPIDFNSWARKFTDLSSRAEPVKFANKSSTDALAPSDFLPENAGSVAVGADPAKVGPGAVKPAP